MSLRFLCSILFAITLAAVSNAQTCPHTRARTVAASVQFHGAQNCGSIKFEAPGIAVRTGDIGCPLFAVYTPPNEVEEPTTAETKTRVLAQTAVQLFFFECHQDWFLFVPIGTSCGLDRIVNGAPLFRLQTIGCNR